MATQKQVTLVRSFNYENANGENKYFVRQNQHEILEFVAPEDLDKLVKSGVITVTEAPVAKPAPKVTAPLER